MILALLVPIDAHWPRGGTIAVWIDSRSAPPQAATLVERAMKTWSAAADGRFTLQKARSAEGAAIRIHFVASGGLYGEARPRLDPRSGDIVSADVVMNADVADMARDEFERRIILYMTALHELGHALGLRHTDDFSTIMYSFRRPDDGPRYFSAYRQRLRSTDDIGGAHASGLADADIAALRALYDR